MPSCKIELICAGQSNAGLAFTARHADYNFCLGQGVNTPAARAAGRTVGVYALFMIIAGDTESEARARWKSYKNGKDEAALAWLTNQAAADKSSGGDTMGTLVGSYGQVASMLDELAAVPGLVVEDEPIQRMMAVDLVEDAGFEAVEATDASQAIEILERRTDIRIVFSDIDMPRGLDGKKLAALIRKRWPPIELVLTSDKALPSPEDLPEGSIFFSKPYHGQELIAVLQRMSA